MYVVQYQYGRPYWYCEGGGGNHIGIVMGRGRPYWYCKRGGIDHIGIVRGEGETILVL